METTSHDGYLMGRSGLRAGKVAPLVLSRAGESCPLACRLGSAPVLVAFSTQLVSYGTTPHDGYLIGRSGLRAGKVAP